MITHLFYYENKKYKKIKVIDEKDNCYVIEISITKTTDRFNVKFRDTQQFIITKSTGFCRKLSKYFFTEQQKQNMIALEKAHIRETKIKYYEHCADIILKKLIKNNVVRYYYANEFNKENNLFDPVCSSLSEEI